ncbi:TPA: stage VI sporulation protein D [Bacillus cereus]|uniref:Stage VI sporulation protein D n=2 Tax=Bacillus cereus group TaxID=86661 RepID=A0A9W7Q1Q5_BACCE|nr:MULTISPECIES: stage VI sporulation protein D [Bacillus]AXR19177.1 stage VI sporulation protein D [Bacillus sp. CR71]AXR24909.1 stage VI sporulation protein D [Bacillus sp. E25]AZV68290.1 stage VI sporulation protein D [Bacillus cereus]EAO55702.1 Stage VI sporulation protein D [Bacillus thuringiensis serovar israelensis ATCC 35646]EEN01185.1 Stage VI sporulation protein D [Bacillus thuringiensis IBL 4222]KAA0788091.1 stage VI sporulation protein D [Bacillus sp. BB56-3]KAA0825058.1 stage VI
MTYSLGGGKEVAADHSLRFSLKESVWFQKGQEVDELLSISLDPDVEIEELDHEVIVRGQLDLTGEYVARQDDSAYSLRELSPAKSIDYVETREDGVNELVHSFPLEISIPRNRVKVIEELYVSIEEFDYELKENGCLQLLADISITGLCDEERSEDEEETVYADLEEDSAQEDENRPAPHVEEPTYKESDEWEDYAFEPFQLEERKEQELEEEKIEEHEFVEREEEQETTPQFELFGRKDFKKEKAKKQEEQEEEYSQRDENALYLTKLFTKEPEEEFTKLRMYFVQEGDTIESIADRYETSVQNLYRVNQTEDIFLNTGQIIYIPVSRVKAK